MLPSVLIWSLALSLVLPQGNTEESCDFNFNITKNGVKVDINDTCKTVPCLIKCCAENEILHDDGDRIYCESTSYLEKTYYVTNLEDYSGLVIYYAKDIKSDKKISDFTIIHYENFSVCESDPRHEISNFTRPSVLENGTLLVSVLGERHEMGDFCFENAVYIDPDNASSPEMHIVFYVKNVDLPESQDRMKRTVISANCMMVSCIFMALVLIVYSLLKELRNLPGIMLMAYLATYTTYCLLRIILVYTQYYEMLDSSGCTIMTLLSYYPLLSSFCWMNTMSFDIWWNLRAFRQQLPTNRRGILNKFAWYALYAWGAPLLPVAFVVLADHVDLPGVVKPEVFDSGKCFFGEESHKYYVCYVIAVLVSVNVVWFVLTAYYIWRVQGAISQFDKEKRKANKKNVTRFLVYVKMCFLMGVCRIFDAVNVEHWFFYTIDGFNACSGFFLFILFVVKRKIFLKLCVRLSIDHKLVQDMRERSMHSTLTTSIDRDRSTNSRQGNRDRKPSTQPLL